MSQGSLNPKSRFLCQKVCYVARGHTHRHTRKWIQRKPFQAFRYFSFNRSLMIGITMVKEVLNRPTLGSGTNRSIHIVIDAVDWWMSISQANEILYNIDITIHCWLDISSLLIRYCLHIFMLTSNRLNGYVTMCFFITGRSEAKRWRLVQISGRPEATRVCP